MKYGVLCERGKVDECYRCDQQEMCCPVCRHAMKAHVGGPICSNCAFREDPDMAAQRHVAWRQVEHPNTWEGKAPMADTEYRKVYDTLVDVMHYYSRDPGGRWAHFATIREG